MRTRCMAIWLLGVAALLLLEAAPGAAAPIWTFDTIPSGGAISGAPGETVGWGYIISNQDASNWLLVTALNPPLFSSADPNLLGIFDFPIIPPNTTVTQPYVPGTAGLYEVTVKLLPPLLFESGLFIVSVDWYNGDPSNGTSEVTFSDQTNSAPGSITVKAPQGPPTVPEPSTWLLVAVGVGGMAFLQTLMQNRS